jgi:hypothetical protein
VARILQNIGGIERAAPGRSTRDPLLSLAFFFGLSQFGSFLDRSLQFFHLPTQLFFFFCELVFFR